MANTNITDAAQQAAANAVVDLVDAGTTDVQGDLIIYDDGAAQPADADDAVPAGSTELARFNLSDPAFGAADVGGAAALQGTTLSTTASAAGTMAWFRVVDKDNAAVFDGDISATGGGGDLQFDNTTVASGQTVEITSLTYTQPA